MNFKSFPSYRQHETKDCGPASLKIISKYYKKSISLKHLRDLTRTSKEGASLFDLANAAEAIGFKSVGVQILFAQLKNAPLPCIIHWKNRHYVVVYRITSKRVYISDPAIGLIDYNHQEFNDAWINRYTNNGYALLLEPKLNFEFTEVDSHKDDNSIKSLLDYLAPYKKYVYYLLICMFVITVLQGILPFVSRSIYDVGIRTHDLDFINIVLVANILLTLAIAAGNIIRDVIVKHVSARIGISLVSDYIFKLNKLPLSYFENRTSGDILLRAQDYERIRSFITSSSFNIIFSVFTFLVFGGILFFYNTSLFWLFLAGSTLYIIWNLSFLKKQNILDHKTFGLAAKNNNYWIETVQSIYDIKLNNYEQARRWEWESVQAHIFKINLKTISLNYFQNFGSQVINGVVNLLLTFICAKSVIAGTMTMGTMIAVQFMIGMLNGPITQIVFFMKALQEAKLSFGRLKMLNEFKDETAGKDTNTIDLMENDNIVLKNVFFKYNTSNKLALKNINIIIPEKKITAIVGESGCGKSSLLKILTQLYQPSSGDVYIGGLHANSINSTQWRSLTSGVLQESKLFNDTLQKNIILDADQIDYEWLKNCISIACISDFIKNLDQGLMTKIGENGEGLSFGQQQRILIARALYRNPRFLFLDEATNALDSKNEYMIMKNLQPYLESKTVIISAHRLSTIENADQIIFMHNGMIEEVGTHQELLAKQGGYFNLVLTQLQNTSNSLHYE